MSKASVSLPQFIGKGTEALSSQVTFKVNDHTDGKDLNRIC